MPAWVSAAALAAWACWRLRRLRVALGDRNVSRTTTVARALILAAWVSGCGTVVSLRPLYTDADLETPIVDARIEGEWISAVLGATTDDAPPTRWMISAPADPSRAHSHYSIEIRNPNGEVQTFEGRFVSMGGTLFFDARFGEDRKGRTVVRDANPPFLLPTHVVGPIWVEKDFLRLAFFDDRWVTENSAEALWHSYGGGPWSATGLVFTGSTEEWRAFVLRHAGNMRAFAIAIYLCRPGVDCELRAAEDMFRRAPGEDDVLDSVADVFSARGAYAHALEARTRRAALAPDDAWRRAELGYACLMNREFQRARAELAAAMRLSRAAAGPEARAPALPSSPSEADTTTDYAALGVRWSHFLEGRYSDVVKPGGDDQTSGRDTASARLTLLKYFSLIRLGRRTQAESLLRRDTAVFEGPSTEHLLLLDAQRRTTDDLGFPHTGTDRARAFFRAPGAQC